LASEKGWPAQERERLERLPADEERRRALFDHPRRLEFVGRALAEMLGGHRATNGTMTSEAEHNGHAFSGGGRQWKKRERNC
jgi:hypothetical protein